MITPVFKLCANECFADAGLFDCIVNVDDVVVAAKVQNETVYFDLDEEVYAMESEEEESWTYSHGHAHDEADDELFDEDNQVWDVHHDDNDSHYIDPFSVALEDCTKKIFVGPVSNGHAAASIARSSDKAVHQIPLEPKEFGCFQILSSTSPEEHLLDKVTVKLSIRNNIYGRFQMTQIPLDYDVQMPLSGFAWQGDADGIVSPSNQSCRTRLKKFSLVTLVLLRSHWG